VSINVYAVGTKIRLSAAFTDIDDDAQDPGGVQFKMRDPAGTVTTYLYGTDVELVRDSLGNYHVDWLIASAGRYRYRFAGVTSGQAAAEGTFNVQNSRVD